MEKIILDACAAALRKAFDVQEIYVNDFKLMIHWDSERNWFEACGHYSPHSSSYYFYERTSEELSKSIHEWMDSWGGKGNYKNNYNYE